MNRDYGIGRDYTICYDEAGEILLTDFNESLKNASLVFNELTKYCNASFSPYEDLSEADEPSVELDDFLKAFKIKQGSDDYR